MSLYASKNIKYGGNGAGQSGESRKNGAGGGSMENTFSILCLCTWMRMLKVAEAEQMRLWNLAKMEQERVLWKIRSQYNVFVGG